MDLIDRQAAIDALWKVHQNRPLDSDRWVITDCLQEIDKLPSAQPERKKGKWINDNGLYQCSCCKHLWSELWWVENCPMERMYKIMRYCPNCGAEMEDNP